MTLHEPESRFGISQAVFGCLMPHAWRIDMKTNHSRKTCPLPSMTLAAVLLSGLGCVSAPSMRSDREMPFPPPPIAAKGPVTADQVNDQNAHSQAQALRSELANE
jgi:hypothetical protein